MGTAAKLKLGRQTDWSFNPRFCFFVFFLERDRHRVREGKGERGGGEGEGKGRERERERMLNRFHAQHGAQHGAPSHHHKVMT